ncbi:MAG: Fic family protein [Candidatus Nanohalarchaeota archaeon]|nr:MAG: Fic family protein [Candidatus Nanohaloarchaeota archaeon]
MFVEKRKAGKKTKYYLVHSYRENSKVQKIRRYLGADLSSKKLEELKQVAQKIILHQIEKLSTKVFDFSLSKKQIEQLNKYDEKITIHHIDKKDWQKFKEEFVYNTNAIEGSRVLQEEVHDILLKKNVSEPDEIETKGVAKAVEYIRATKEDFSLSLIKKLHELCFRGSKDFAGKIREVEVVIKNSSGDVVHSGVPASHLDLALKDMISWYNSNRMKFKPLFLAGVIHNQFEYIHPFQDGNGRVGRLLLNFILIKNKYPPLNILLQDRQKYYKTLQEYSKRQDMKTTLEFLIEQYNKTFNGDHKKQ